MKTTFNYFRSLASVSLSFVCVNVLIFLALFFAQLDARAEGLMDSCVESAYYGQTFYAMAGCTPAMNPAVTEIAIKTTYDGLPGFESAQLYASLVAGGNVLTVTLTGFSGEQLPEDKLLGIITLNDGSSEKTFSVSTEGGAIIVVLDGM